MDDFERRLDKGMREVWQDLKNPVAALYALSAILICAAAFHLVGA